MANYFDRPVSEYMSRMLETAEADTPVERVASILHARGISGVPVLRDGRLVGVLTRTDLVQLGAFQAGRRWTSPAMPLPHRRAWEVMTPDPRTITSTTTLREAAKIMSEHAIHRLFVVDDDRLVGLISTLDITAAVADAKVTVPLSSVMTSPPLTLDAHAPLSSAVDLLARVMVTGVIVVEDGLPIGVFTQFDALASRDLPRTTPIETTFDAGVICLPEDTKLHRAAAQAAQLDVRRVVACRNREAMGVVSGLDFCRIAGA